MFGFDFHKRFIQSADEAIRNISAINPLHLRRKATRTKALVALSLVCFFWGTTWLASKEGVKYMPPLEMAGIRQILAGICYVVFFVTTGARLPRGREWYPVLVLSFLNFMCSNGLSTWGIKYISAGLGSIIGAIFPLWIVVIGLFTSREKIPLRAIIGLTLGFGGVCIIFLEHLNDFLDPGFRLGILLSLAATVSWAFGTLYTKKQALHFNPYFSLGLQMIISGSGLYFISTLDPAFTPLTRIPWQSWGAIAYLIIFGSLLSFICFLYALQHLPTGQTSIYAYVNPMVAVALGAVLLNEKVTAFIITGGLVTLLGIYLVNKAYRVMPVPKTPVTKPETGG